MVVVIGGNVLHHVKREGNCPGGGMSGGACPGGICPGKMSGSPEDRPPLYVEVR